MLSLKGRFQLLLLYICDSNSKFLIAHAVTNKINLSHGPNLEACKSKGTTGALCSC